MTSKIVVNNIEADAGINTVTISGDVTATNVTGIHHGSAANLTSIPAGNLTGTISDARLSSVTASKLTGALPALDGSALTGVGVGTADSINTSGIITATAFVPTTGQLSHRNLIINGQFLIWQRATDSGSNTTDGYLSCDRWYHASSGATKQVARQTFALGQTDVPDNPKYYLRYAVTTGNNNVALRQRIEDVTRCQGEMTFSFWVKGSNPGGGHFDLIFRQNFGTGGGSVSNVVDSSIANYTVSNTWTKKTFTFTPASISGKTLGSTDHTSYYEIELFRQPAGDTSTAAFTVDFANVQLERGSVATPFEHRSYGEEIMRCYRYYYAHKGMLWGATSAGDHLDLNITFPVPMRAAPSRTQVDTSLLFKNRLNQNNSTSASTYSYSGVVSPTGDFWVARPGSGDSWGVYYTTTESRGIYYHAYEGTTSYAWSAEL